MRTAEFATVPAWRDRTEDMHTSIVPNVGVSGVLARRLILDVEPGHMTGQIGV